jgi:hypothetical protein
MRIFCRRAEKHGSLLLNIPYIYALLLSKQEPLFTMKTKQSSQQFREQYKKRLFMNFWRKTSLLCVLNHFRPVGRQRGKIPLQVSSQISSKPGVSHASFFPADSKKVLFPLVSGLELTEVHRNVSFGTQKSSANKAALAGWLEFCRFSLSLAAICVCVRAVNESRGCWCVSFMHAQQRRGNCCFQEKVFCFVSFFRALRGCHSRRVIFLVDNASFIETCLHNHKASIHQASAINFHDPSERAARGRRRKSARCPRKFRPGKYPGRIMYTHTVPAKNATAALAAWKAFNRAANGPVYLHDRA